MGEAQARWRSAEVPGAGVRWWKVEGSMLSGAVAAANGASLLSGGATTSNSYLEKLLPAALGNLTPC